MEKPNDLKSRFVIKGGEYDSDFEVKNISLRQVVVTGTPQQEGKESGMKCFPNPVGNQLHIRFQLETASHIKLELFNLKGQLIQSVYEGESDSRKS